MKGTDCANIVFAFQMEGLAFKTGLDLLRQFPVELAFWAFNVDLTGFRNIYLHLFREGDSLFPIRDMALTPYQM